MDIMSCCDSDSEADSNNCHSELIQAFNKKSYYHAVDSRYPVCSLTLPEIYEEQAKLNNGHGVTWYRPAEQMTYTKLYQKAMDYAKGLLALGLRKGDNLCCFGTQGSDGAAMFVAASSLGIKFAAPFLYSPVPSTINMFIRRLEPKVIVIGNSGAGTDLKKCFNTVIDCLASNNNAGYQVPHIFYDNLAEKDNSCHTKNCDTALPLSELAAAGAIISEKELKQHKRLVTENEPVLYSPSSGTTGEPKLVVIGAAIFANGGMRKMERFDCNVNSRYACPNMCSEEIGFIEELTAGFFTGYEILALPHAASTDVDSVVHELLDAIEYASSTIVYADQSYLAYFINHPQILKGHDISCVEGWILGGSGMSANFKQTILNNYPKSADCYGLSENYYCISPRLGDNVKKVLTIGKPAVNHEVKIVDEKGCTVRRGKKGELCIRGFGTFIEYLGQPELTKSMKTEDGWLKTGDCAIMDDEGDLRIVGRMSHAERFKVCGDVVYAQCVENTMKENKKIKEIRVLGRPSGTTYGHELIYCVVPYDDDKLTAEEIRQYAEQNLKASNEWPVYVYFYEKFPLYGSRNKVSRTVLSQESFKKIEQDPKDGLVDHHYLD